MTSDEPAPPSMRQMRQWVEAAQQTVQWQGRQKVSIALMSASAIAALNKQFCGKAQPTNVLSFPAPASQQELGDIAVCGEVIAAESRQFGLPPHERWAHMVVHAALHLMGYDHATPPTAAAMERLESETLLRLGMADPWGRSADCPTQGSR